MASSDYHPETKRWKELAELGADPYDCRDVGVLTYLSVIEHNGAVSFEVEGQGLFRLRIVNQSFTRTKRVKTKSVFDQGHNRWALSEPAITRDRRRFEYNGFVRHTPKSGSAWREKDVTAAFEVTGTGADGVVTSWSAEGRFIESSFYSRYEALLVKKETTMDWVGALLEMGKGVPGGQAIMGPVAYLRSQSEAAKFNRTLDRHFSEGKRLSEDMLGRMLSQEKETRELRMAIQLLVPLIEELASADQRGVAPRRAVEVLSTAPRISRFPLPFDRSIVFEEFCEVFASDEVLEVLEECLERAGFPRGRGNTRLGKIREAVDSLVGQPVERVCRLFECLHSYRQGSGVFSVAREILCQKRSGEGGER